MAFQVREGLPDLAIGGASELPLYRNAIKEKMVGPPGLEPGTKRL